MADQWYYTEQGQQVGPVSEADLRRYAAAGRLQPHDLVWKEGMPRWVPAEAVPEFAFRAEEPQAPAAPSRRAPTAADRPRPRHDDFDDRPRPRRRAEPEGLSTGAKVAIGLGIGGGVLLLFIVVVVVIAVLASRNAISTNQPLTAPVPKQRRRLAAPRSGRWPTATCFSPARRSSGW